MKKVLCLLLIGFVVTVSYGMEIPSEFDTDDTSEEVVVSEGEAIKEALTDYFGDCTIS